MVCRASETRTEPFWVVRRREMESTAVRVRMFAKPMLPEPPMWAWASVLGMVGWRLVPVGVKGPHAFRQSKTGPCSRNQFSSIPG